MRLIIPKELQTARDVYFVLEAVKDQHVKLGHEWQTVKHIGGYGKGAEIWLVIEEGFWPSVRYEYQLVQRGSGKSKRMVWELESQREP